VRRRVLPTLIVATVAIAYPISVLAGGGPHFPRPGECVHPAQEGSELIAVFGRFRDRAAAEAMLHRITALGFKGSKVERDGCGFVRVVVHGIPSLAVGEDLVAEARRVRLQPVLESVSGAP
jgi:hypothetical protein